MKFTGGYYMKFLGGAVFAVVLLIGLAVIAVFMILAIFFVRARKGSCCKVG